MELFLEQLVHSQGTTQTPDLQLGTENGSPWGLSSSLPVKTLVPYSRHCGVGFWPPTALPRTSSIKFSSEVYVAGSHDVVEDAGLVVCSNAIDGYSVLQDKVEDGAQPVHP